MNAEAVLLQEKISQVLAWEKRKRREQVLVIALFYSLAGALAIWPLYLLVPLGASRWITPALFFVLLVPLQLFRRRWGRGDCAKALVRVDQALNLDERTITAWEILAREQTRAAEFLVLKEASAGIKALESRALFPRQFSWHGYFVLPLFTLWFALLWFNIGVPSRPAMLPWRPNTQAEKLREFSRQLQEKAEREELPDSLRIGQELETMARRQLESRTPGEPFKRELSAMAKKIEAMGRTHRADGEFLAAAGSQADLNDLKAELEAAREELNFPAAGSGAGRERSRWLEKLAALPQLKQQFALKGRQARGLNRNEMRNFLDKLDEQVAGELDRRTLLDAEQFIQQLLEQGPGNKGESQIQVAGQGSEDLPADAEKARSRSRQPGKEPGTRESASRSLPGLQAGAAAQLGGMLRPGQSSSIILPGKPQPEQSVLGQDEVIASYRRQAEAELNSERVPEGLKETVKQYFLSLRQENRSP
jgi:hypothetical protein